jgi:hypothetical protein
MQIARLSLSGVNEKMRFAAHTVWGNLRPTDSSHLHCLDVAFGPPAIAKASVRKSAQKQKPLMSPKQLISSGFLPRPSVRLVNSTSW